MPTAATRRLDHFYQAQRKNIQGWRHQLTEVKSVMSRFAVEEIDDIDLSDDEESEPSWKARSRRRARLAVLPLHHSTATNFKESENWHARSTLPDS